MSKIDEVKAKLDESGIEYDPEAKLSELKKLLPTDSEDDSEIDEVEEQITLDAEMEKLAAEEAAKKAELPVLSKAEQKKTFIKIIANYKKQNPIKYAKKKAAFEKRLASFDAVDEA